MTHTQMHKLIGAAAIALSAVACSEKQIDINNPNSALTTGVTSDPTALQMLATGLFTDQRGTRQAMITNTGIFGREMYTLTPQEGRNTTHFLLGITVGGVQKLDPSGFANGSWTGQYGMLRDIFNFKASVNAAPLLSAAQKSAAIGLAETFEGMMVLELLETRDTRGVVTESKADPLVLARFVTRDSGYKFVMGILDDANTKLAAGGSAFPFTVAPGFGTSVAGADFTTPTGFALFNRAMKARAAAE